MQKILGLTSCCSTTFYGLLHLLLVLPAEEREPTDVTGGLSCRPLPEAGEVVPVWDLPIKHGRLQDKRKHTEDTMHEDWKSSEIIQL